MLPIYADSGILTKQVWQWHNSRQERQKYAVRQMQGTLSDESVAFPPRVASNCKIMLQRRKKPPNLEQKRVLLALSIGELAGMDKLPFMHLPSKQLFTHTREHQQARLASSNRHDTPAARPSSSIMHVTCRQIIKESP
ncbi:hypothetical protein [Collimonas arenae]|uniref:hypothetical protein n=1 Tax=Collimonas arenae TaxID=279058 RepID=UPI000FE13E71|nr:hypothetical protein [Collimonas arenae]